MMSRTFACLALLFVSAAHAVTIEDLSDKDTASGLREALVQGATKAVNTLGRTDGFLGNPKVRIPLPGSLKRVEGMMRGVGMGRYADELETAMNRAAEAAVPEAKTLLVNSVKQMSVQDAKGILTGGDDAAARYFKRATQAPLSEKFKPIVRKAMAKVQLAQKYEQFAGTAAKFGLVDEADTHLDNYVTNKALDGLYLMIAEEEKLIRQDPLSAAGRAARKVFGVLQQGR